MKTQRIINVIALMSAIVLIGLMADTIFAQCAMCRGSVTPGFAKNLNLAILVLFVPPVSIFATIFFIAFRKRKG